MQILKRTRIQKLTKSTRTRKDAPHNCQWKYNFKFKIKGYKFELQKRGKKQMAASGTYLVFLSSHQRGAKCFHWL